MRFVALFFIGMLAVGAFPFGVRASIVWSSAATHPDEVLVFSSDTSNFWFGGTSAVNTIRLGTWDQPDFTTTASTSARLWARWNGSYISTLDISLRAALGGDPFYGSGTTTAQVVGNPTSFYDFGVSATSTLAEYTLPVIPAATIHRGDELWAWIYPSWASYGATHWLGSSGTLPSLELCEGSCTSSSPPTLTLLGSATTTAEFGATYTDSGATASDTIDGDLTSAIQITGSVNTSIMGTTTLTYAVTNSSGLSATTTRDVVVACTHDCYSNVLFLPGIEGSRLYEGTGCVTSAAEEKLWEPVESAWSALWGKGDTNVKKLFLDSSGKSVCSDVHAKADDILDSVGGGNIYKSFVDEMNALKSGGTIADWKAAAYDWRFSLTDLLNNGVERGGKIYYEEATSTPYIEQTLRSLAASSRTGKVSIVAHSNGGLVAKALLNQLGGSTSKSLVDRMILVGAPQSGAPESLGALLVGYSAGIYKFGFPIVSNAVARELALNSPMAYHLLPSENYLTSVAGDADHPVARFAGGAYAKELSAYGATIGDKTEMDGFIRAFSTAINSPLIDYANAQHDALDSWAPPDGIEVYQVAGWGANTIAGIDFYTLPPVNALSALEPVGRYNPILTEDGDGVVPVPSALMMASSTNVKRYWVNLDKFNREKSLDRKHKDIFEIPQVEDFIKNIIKNNTSTLPTYILDSQPSSTNNKKLIFILHSPLTLELKDSSGNVTGIATDGSMTQDIPDSTYGEFGEAKYIIAPVGGQYTLTMHGQESGTFSLDIQESSSGVVTASSTLANLPTTPSTLASLTISGGLETASALTVDKNGDGFTIKVMPKAGETVNYIEPRRTLWKPSPVAQPANTDAASEPPVAATPAADVGPISASSSDSVASTSPVRESAPEAVVQIEKKAPEIIAIDKKKSVSREVIAPEKKSDKNVPQTASVYDASQQQVLHRLGTVVYNSLHRLWRGFKRMLLIET